jgi:hypothetical protein
MKKSQVPKGKRVAYARTVVAVRPEKEEINRVRITVGGNLFDYLGETSTEAASIETTKLLINSVLSTPGARLGTINISNFYIQKYLKDYQYMRFHISMIPQETIDEYNLTDIMEADGWLLLRGNPQSNVWNQRKRIHCQSRTQSDTSKARIHHIQIHTWPVHPQDSKYSILISSR